MELKFDPNSEVAHRDALASVALLLGFPFTMVPASQTYTNTYPQGTSPSTDHLCGNEACSIYYDGGRKRVEKLRFLSHHPEALQLLRVCWQDNGYNCGKCEKCLRTMLMLKILEVDCPTLPPLDDLRMIKHWRIETDAQKHIFGNIISAAMTLMPETALTCADFCLSLTP